MLHSSARHTSCQPTLALSVSRASQQHVESCPHVEIAQLEARANRCCACLNAAQLSSSDRRPLSPACDAHLAATVRIHRSASIAAQTRAIRTQLEARIIVGLIARSIKLIAQRRVEIGTRQQATNCCNSRCSSIACARCQASTAIIASSIARIVRIGHSSSNRIEHHR